MAGSLPRPDASQDQLKEWRLDPGFAACLADPGRIAACLADLGRLAVVARVDANVPGPDLVENPIDEFWFDVHPVVMAGEIVVPQQGPLYSLSSRLVVKMVQAQRVVE